MNAVSYVLVNLNENVQIFKPKIVKGFLFWILIIKQSTFFIYYDHVVYPLCTRQKFNLEKLQLYNIISIFGWIRAKFLVKVSLQIQMCSLVLIHIRRASILLLWLQNANRFYDKVLFIFRITFTPPPMSKNGCTNILLKILNWSNPLKK